MQGYFMSDEAEKAAKWNVVEQFNEAKEHLLALESVMTNLGKQWAAFSEALKEPNIFVFDVTKNVVTLGQSNAGLRRPLGQLTPGDMNWEKFCALLTDYQETSRKKTELICKLHDAGLSVN